MIETSAMFAQRIAESSRQFKARFKSGNETVSGIIRNMVITKGACGEQNFSIGSIFSPYIEVVLNECEEPLENKELLLQIGLAIEDGSFEYVNLGYYTVIKPQTSAYQTSFTAVGRISAKLNCLPNSIPDEQTLENIAAVITDTTGVPILCHGVALEGTIETDLNGYTCLSLLKIITDVLGGFATEDGNGNIVISSFSTVSLVECNGDRTTSAPEFNDYDYELSGIEVIVKEAWTDENGVKHDAISYTEGTPRQTLTMDYMTESLFSVFKNVVGYTYRPGKVPLALGDPRIEPWDCLLFTDVKGNSYTVPCLNIVHSFDGGLSTIITAPGDSKTESDSQLKGPLALKLEKITSQMTSVQDSANKAKAATIVEIYDEYAISSDINTAPNGGWSTERPNVNPGDYIWRRSTHIYGNGDTVVSDPVCITGQTGKDGEDATTLRIESSRGTVFKNSEVSTVLSAVIYKGAKRITDITALRNEFGVTARLEWLWQRIGEETFGTILSTDTRIGNNGFTFTLTPTDVDTKVVFVCQLIIE